MENAVMKTLILSILALLLFSIGAYSQCYIPSWSEPSHDSMLIYVSLASLNSINLQAGDEIGIFDRERCVGVGVLTEELTGPPIYLVIEVSRDSRESPGFRPGRTIIYRFCSGGEEVNTAVLPTYLTNGPDFVPNDSCLVELRAVNTAPTVTSIPDTVAAEDVLYSSSITAEDIDGDDLTYTGTDIPGWLLFNMDTQLLSGTPGNAEVGYHSVTLSVSDGSVTVDTTFTIRVANENDAPTFTFVADIVALEDVLYTSAITAADIDIGDILIFTARRLPSWLSFNDTTNILSGTPVNGDEGDDEVRLRINDGTVNVETSFIIHVSNVNDAPTFTSTQDTTAKEGELYTYTATADDEEGDGLSFSAPVLPHWLSFDTTTHMLSGTPGNDHLGDNSVVLRINDGTSDVVQSFVIAVENVNDPPTITSVPVTEARPGLAYSYTVTAEDIDGDALTYTALVLPGWLTFNSSTHILSATPGEGDTGDQHVSIRVSDESFYIDQTFIITVGYANHAPTFTSDPATSVVIGDSYVYTITANDIDGDALTYSAPLLPDWLAFDSVTHAISGSPRSSDLGPHDVTLRVSDGTVSADQSFPVIVENVNSAPNFTSTPVTSALEGELYIYYALAEDVDGDDFIFSAPLLPDWLSFDVVTQVLYGTPDREDAGDHNVKLRASDGEGAEDQNFVITVEVQYGVGIDDFRSPNFMVVYPNPSDGRFIVELSRELERKTTLEIINPLGKVLLLQEFPPYTLIKEEYKLSDHPAGNYFIRVYNISYQTIKKLMIH